MFIPIVQDTYFASNLLLPWQAAALFPSYVACAQINTCPTVVRLKVSGNIDDVEGMHAGEQSC
jgi:hypothetical protein